MKIELTKVKVSDLVNGYSNFDEKGVLAYGGKLDVRHPYQREFIYKREQEESVINTVLKNFPLNTMYWSVRDDGTYEIIDGQQRTLSICRYYDNQFSFKLNGHSLMFSNLLDDIKNIFLNYELTVYLCEGTDTERLEWFKVINIAGEKLSDQELRNAVYHGTWLSDAKRYFSKNNCAGYNLSKDYVSADVNRQGLLERVIKWISKNKIDEYMAIHQHDPSASELWRYFNDVINWITTTFIVKRSKEMKRVDWGPLYDKFCNQKLDPGNIEQEISKLLKDDDVTNKSGIYPYILTRDEKYLSIRQFDESDKITVYEKQNHICAHCHKSFDISKMDADHIIPWSRGGKTKLDNLQMLCKECNRRKGNK